MKTFSITITDEEIWWLKGAVCGSVITWVIVCFFGRSV